MVSIFTIATAPTQVFGHRPVGFGLASTGQQPDDGGTSSFLIELEDGTGTILLEDGSGSIELEIGP
jgi:hypothetical protein